MALHINVYRTLTDKVLFSLRNLTSSLYSNDTICLEIVMNEMRKNQNFPFDLQIHPTLLNSTCLHCQMTGFIPIRVQIFQNIE